MAYATQTDVENAAGGAAKLIELADWDADGSVDAAVLTDAIAAADEWINSYAQRRYDVPFATTPDIVRRFAAQEAVYRLRLGRNALTDADQVRHEELREWLDNLARGIVSVGVDPEPAASDAHVAQESDRETDIDSDEGKISRESLKGFW